MITIDTIRKGLPWASTSRPLPTSKDIMDRIDLARTIHHDMDMEDVLNSIEAAFHVFVNGRGYDRMEEENRRSMQKEEAVELIRRVGTGVVFNALGEVMAEEAERYREEFGYTTSGYAIGQALIMLSAAIGGATGPKE